MVRLTDQEGESGSEQNNAAEPDRLGHWDSFDRRPFSNPESYNTCTLPVSAIALHPCSNIQNEGMIRDLESEGIRRIGIKRKRGSLSSLGSYGPHPVLLRASRNEQNILNLMEGMERPALVLTPLKSYEYADCHISIVPEVQLRQPHSHQDYLDLFKHSRLLELLALASGYYPWDFRPANAGFLSDGRPVIFDQATTVSLNNQFESIPETRGYSLKEFHNYLIRRDIYECARPYDVGLTLHDDEYFMGNGGFQIPDWYTKAEFLAQPPFADWLKSVFDPPLLDELLKGTATARTDSDSDATLTAKALVKLEALLTEGTRHEIMERISTLQPLIDRIRSKVNSLYGVAQQAHNQATGAAVGDESLLKDRDFEGWIELRKKNISTDEIVQETSAKKRRETKEVLKGSIVTAIEEDGLNRNTLHAIVMLAATKQADKKPWRQCVEEARNEFKPSLP